MSTAALVVSLLALLVAGAAAWWARVSAAAAVRSADAAERAVALEVARDARYAPPWSLRWVKGDTYELRNVGDEAVYDVEIDFSDLAWSRGEKRHSEIHARAAVTFMAKRAWATSENVAATVTWHRRADLSDSRQSWRHPLPIKAT